MPFGKIKFQHSAFRIFTKGFSVYRFHSTSFPSRSVKVESVNNSTLKLTDREADPGATITLTCNTIALAEDLTFTDNESIIVHTDPFSIHSPDFSRLCTGSGSFTTNKISFRFTLSDSLGNVGVFNFDGVK